MWEKLLPLTRYPPATLVFVPFLEYLSIFRPGDIALARVISLGDAGAGYLLTTAENELGVVIARF